MKKIFQGLLLVPLLALSTNASFAVNASDSQAIQAVLDSYIDIKAETSGAVTTTTINPDDGSLATALVSKFRIRTNGGDSKVYLRAKVNDSSSVGSNAFFVQGGQNYIVLGNITVPPDIGAVADCKNGAPTASSNANAIAYPISNVEVDNSGSTQFNNSKKEYTVDIKTGQSFLTTTLGTVALSNTYSYEDQAGTYEAILTLTTTTI